MKDFLHFWSAWLRGPQRIGAVAPSSPALGRAMATAVPADGAGWVIELGAGTGAITRELANRFSRDRLLIVERDPRLSEILNQRFSGYRIITTDAQHLQEALNQLSERPVNAIVSALPLLSLPEHDRDSIIRIIYDLIRDNGRLIQFTYGLGEPVPPRLARELGLQGRRIRYVLRNIPPASVWEYTAH